MRLQYDYKTSELIEQKSVELLRNMITFGNNMINSKGIYLFAKLHQN